MKDANDSTNGRNLNKGYASSNSLIAYQLLSIFQVLFNSIELLIH